MMLYRPRNGTRADDIVGQELAKRVPLLGDLEVEQSGQIDTEDNSKQ